MPERGVDSSGGLHGSHRCQPELLNRESEGDIVQHNKPTYIYYKTLSECLKTRNPSLFQLNVKSNYLCLYIYIHAAFTGYCS
jgi:hypothetical protein